MKKLALIPFMLLFSILVIWNIADKSPTADEYSHHIASGYSELLTGDFRMNPAEPPVSRLLSAIPLYFLHAKLSLGMAWDKGDSPAFADNFFHANDQDTVTFWARVPILVISLILAYFIFVWANDLFGFIGGLSASIMYMFCPDVLTHSALATSDITVAFFFYMTLWRFWKYLRKPNNDNLGLVGIMAGLAMASKYSAILLFPIMLIIMLVTRKKPKLWDIEKFAIVTFMTIWLCYGFEFKPLLNAHTPNLWNKVEWLHMHTTKDIADFAREVPIPLSTFFSSFFSMIATRSHGTNCFLNGQWSHGIRGWWYYYIEAFGLKSTIPMLLLLGMSAVMIKRLNTPFINKVFLVTPILLLFAVTMDDKAQAGVRYFLPIYPFTFILIGSLFSWAFE